MHRDFSEETDGKRPLGTSRSGWEDIIKMALKEIDLEGVYWTDLAQNRDGWRALLNAVMNLRVT